MANLGLAQAILFSEDFSSSNDKTPPSGWAFKLLQGITANDSYVDIFEVMENAQDQFIGQ